MTDFDISSSRHDREKMSVHLISRSVLGELVQEYNDTLTILI